MNEDQSKKKIRAMHPQKRIATAVDKIEILYSCFTDCVQTQSNIGHIAFGNKLISQIPASYAGHAYNALADNLLQYLLLRVCSIWDKLDYEKESLPTVHYLLSDDHIRSDLKVSKLADCHQSYNIMRNSVPEDVAKTELRSCLEHREELFELAWSNWHAAYCRLKSDQRLARLRFARNCIIAHNINLDLNKKMTGAVSLPNFHDVEHVLRETGEIILNLFSVVKNVSISIDDITRRAERNANQLWNGCQFAIKPIV